MNLYYAPGTCSLAPHIALREAGIPVELKKVDLKTKQYDGGDYHQVNAKGYVPALETPEGVLTECAVILLYIADFFNPALNVGWRQAVTERLGVRLDWVAKQVEDRPYLMGDRFSVADAYLFTILNWAAPSKFDLSKWPTIVDFHQRVAARPKVQEALKAEGLLK